MPRTPPAPVPRLGIEPNAAPRVVIRVPLPPGPTTFFHAGDAGDIIYALPFIKAVGGGKLFIGPDARWNTNSNRDLQRYHWLLPLLRCQPYLESAEYVSSKPSGVSYDLNLFREIWMTDAGQRHAMGLTRLFEAYPKRFGHPPLSETDSWLTVDPIPHPDRPVVIHRSSRYRNSGFPWREVVERYAHLMLFVGLRSEYEEWIATYGRAADYHATKNALEMAQVLAGSKLFIGNQSSPNAIALGLGIPVIQEVCPSTPDCVFRRPNTQYFFRNPIQWPEVGRRYVKPRPNADGIIEIGPCCEANGLGDYLSVTPVARELGEKCVMKVPVANAEIAKLFEGLCPVELTDSYPVFRHIGGAHSSEAKLQLFGLESASPLPTVRVTKNELSWAQSQLSRHERPICFVPSCSRHWAHVRQRPPEYWAHILPRINDHAILQFGYQDYPLVPGAVRMPFYGLRQLAAIYACSGEYLGVDTGDAHLMLGVGGRVVVVAPDEAAGYSHKEWRYHSERAIYVNFNNPLTIHGHFNGG